MPGRLHFATGGLVCDVPNRRIGRLPLFEKPADYLAFEKILLEPLAWYISLRPEAHIATVEFEVVRKSWFSWSKGG